MRSGCLRTLLAAVATIAFIKIADAQSVPEVVAPASRDVTPPGVTPGPDGAGPLLREPPPSGPPDPARWRKFHLPKTSDASTLNVDKRKIHISGVRAPAADAACRRADGSIRPS